MSDPTYTPDPADERTIFRKLRQTFHNPPWAGHGSVAAECHMCQTAAHAALSALAAEGRLLPEPTEVREEWAVWWHSGDSTGIVLSEGKIGSRERADRRGKERIGEYGITRYTLRRREHRVYADGSTWIGAWEKVADDDA